MEHKPETNLSPDSTIDSTSGSGSDTITVHGSIGQGAVVGQGSMTVRNIVGGDMTLNNSGVMAGDQAQFSDLLIELKELLVKAHQCGEMPEPQAKEAIQTLDRTVTDIKKEEKPPRPAIVTGLERVADMIEDAVDIFNSQGAGVAKTLIRALPIAALLVKLALRIF
mgnify:CR=1 FL=1